MDTGNWAIGADESIDLHEIIDLINETKYKGHVWLRLDCSRAGMWPEKARNLQMPFQKDGQLEFWIDAECSRSSNLKWGAVRERDEAYF